MVVKARDPITDTTWFNPNNISGSVMTMLGGVLGIGALLWVLSLAQGEFLPRWNSLVSSASGGRVNTGDTIGFRGDL